MNRKEATIIAEIDGVCGCDTPKYVLEYVLDGMEGRDDCGKCNKPHRTDFVFDHGEMLHLLNRWADNESEDETVSFDSHRKNGVTRIELSASNIQTGGRIFGEGISDDFITAAKDALIQISEKS